ncbi:MAG: aldo/keto reductase, partial [Christensenellales bacterium]
LYQLCEQKDVAITVMKTLGAGKLLSPEHTPFSQPLTVAQCIHYALTRPAVVSTLLGCKSRREIQEAVAYLELGEQEKDYAHVLGSFQNNFKGQCVYCSHCQPCPVEIDIAAVNKYLDIAKLDESSVPPSIRQHYSHLHAHGSDCIACGNCESRCPFSVPIIENMHQAAQVFEK